MLNEICAEIRNYFCKAEDRIIGDWSIVDGRIVPSVDLADGQYYRIIGSVFNDGVHKSDEVLADEAEFHGAIWKMRVPQDVIQLADDIEVWKTKNADTIASPYVSESFGGYSYSKGSGSDGTIGVSWKNQSEFASRLRPYRRIRVI